MDKKLAIPAGLAILVVMAVAGMVSVFNLTFAQPAEASMVNPQIEQANVDLDKLIEGGQSNNGNIGTFNDSVTGVYLTANPSEVGDGARLKVDIELGATGTLAAGSGEVTIRFDSSKFGIPATIANTHVTISADSTTTGIDLNQGKAYSVNPSGVTVSYEGSEGDLAVVTLIVPDMDPDDNTGQNGIALSANVDIVFLQSAGITLPKKAGGYDISVKTSTQTVYYEHPGDEITLYRDVTLSAVSGGRGDSVTATASGFASGTATFWVDSDGDGNRDAGETDLCSGVVSSNVATCDFTVANPPFTLGSGTTCTVASTVDCNYVNAVDGEAKKNELSNQADMDRAIFTLEGSVTTSPATANPGDTITVQIVDGATGSVGAMTIGGTSVTVPSTTIPSSGAVDFTVDIPDGIPSGTQKLIVADGGGSASSANSLKVNITIGTATVTVTPSDGIVPNQRVTMGGSGFTASGTIRTIELGGETIHTSKINDASTINIDSGGSWSSSVDLPISDMTANEGTHELKITDGSGRIGTADVTVKTRTLTITPTEGRVGSNVTVKGTGFPAKNNDGNSSTVSVEYNAGSSTTNSATVTPDAGGDFTVTIQVPSGASIPSTNSVKATYDLYTSNTQSTKSGTTDITTVTHSVPSAGLSLGASSGAAGSTVNASGVGFKRYTTITKIEVGDIEVTPSPKPATDANGDVSFDFVIPGTDNGVQTVKLTVGGTAASVGFTVTDDLVSDVVTPTATALEPLLTAETLVSAFYFNNSTKAFDFHIADAAFADANTLADVQSGEPLWIEVTADTTAELNGKSFDLTCVNGDCFNLIVFP